MGEHDQVGGEMVAEVHTLSGPVSDGEVAAEVVGALVKSVARPWALRPEALDVLCGALEGRLALPAAGLGDFSDSPAAQVETVGEGGTAVIPLQGVITPSAPGLLALLLGLGGGLEAFKSQLLEAAASSDVERIVLNVDSPGGIVDLVPETAALIRQVRQEKPIIAVANTQIASAAYWLAAQATEVVVTPSGEVGSVGAYMMHADRSQQLEEAGIKVTLTSAGRYKTEGNQYEPLDSAAAQARQEKVDTMYGMFVADVAAGRGTSEAAVRAGYGEGRTLYAESAVAEGLADRIATLDEVLGETVTDAAAQGSGQVESHADESEEAEEPEEPEADEEAEAEGDEDEEAEVESAETPSRKRRIMELI